MLACAPSNLAVDNLVEKLGTAKAKVQCVEVYRRTGFNCEYLSIVVASFL